MSNLGNYIFKAEEGEDILANDGSSFSTPYAKIALGIIQQLKSLPLSLGCEVYPKGYEEDLIQSQRRSSFDPKEWLIPSFSLDFDGNVSKILFIHSSHREEGYLYSVKGKAASVCFFRGFSIQEFPEHQPIDGNEFLESIGLGEAHFEDQIKLTSLDDEDEESPIIEIQKPAFSGLKKKKILNLGGKAIEEAEDDEEIGEDEEEELHIEVSRSAFQASSKKKIANLGFAGGDSRPEKYFDEEEEEVVISVDRPSFEATSGKKPKNLDVPQTHFKPKEARHESVEPIVFSPAKQGKIHIIKDENKAKKKDTKKEDSSTRITPVSPVDFTPAKQGKIETIKDQPQKVVDSKPQTPPVQPQIIPEENEWGSIDVFKLKPQVFKGERAAIKHPDFALDLSNIASCENLLSSLKEIRVSKKAVFSPKVWEESNPLFASFSKFDYSQWDFLACTIDQDDDIIYALLSNKAIDKFSILISFKHHEPHLVGISTNGIALDDRALPYLSFAELKKMVLGK